MYFQKNIPVVAGTPVVVDLLGWSTPCTVTAVPGASGSMLVEVSTTDTAISAPGLATWITWPSGSVTSPASNRMDSPVRALRVTATTSSGRLELIG